MSNEDKESLYRSFPERKDKKTRCPNPACNKELPIDARRCTRCGICLECG